MRAIVLIQVDFDSMENHNPLSERIIETFVEDPKIGSAYAVMSDWWRTHPPIQHYAGYDGQVYPQFKTVIKY